MRKSLAFRLFGAALLILAALCPGCAEQDDYVRKAEQPQSQRYTQPWDFSAPTYSQP
ncbi:MAG TPA: hypothetical protein VGX70_10115 [Gemmataceae bacterium]|jgi:hypothetical protein|nr:hypothetical protein [Gemmataceae bacterium]